MNVWKLLVVLVVVVGCSRAPEPVVPARPGAAFRSERGFSLTFPADWASVPSDPPGVKTDGKPWLFFLEGPFEGVGGRKVRIIGTFTGYSPTQLGAKFHVDVLKTQLERTATEKTLRRFPDGFVTEHPVNDKQTRLEMHRLTKQGSIDLSCYCARTQSTASAKRSS
ncbi:MAG: hypothetical protein QM775_01485 [Pirellulales bacterium]